MGRQESKRNEWVFEFCNPRDNHGWIRAITKAPGTLEQKMNAMMSTAALRDKMGERHQAIGQHYRLRNIRTGEIIPEEALGRE